MLQQPIEIENTSWSFLATKVIIDQGKNSYRVDISVGESSFDK